MKRRPTGDVQKRPTVGVGTVGDMNTETNTITAIDSITLDVADPEAAARFYADAFGLSSDRIRVRQSDAASSGFRGYTLSLVTSQPANVRALFDAAVAAGATVLKPVEKSLWGVGGVVQAPDGAIWNLATSAKKDTGPATKDFEHLVQYIHDAHARTEHTQVKPLAAGLYGDSRFYPARGHFHLFNTCNVWTARALQAAGLPMQPRLAVTASALIDQAARHGRCLQCSGRNAGRRSDGTPD